MCAQPDVARDALVEVVHEDDADWPASTWPVGSIPMDEYALDQARWLAEALGAGRPLSASDLAVGDRSGQTGARRDELGARQDVVTARYRAAATELTDARDRATDPSATDPAARTGAATSSPSTKLKPLEAITFVLTLRLISSLLRRRRVESMRCLDVYRLNFCLAVLQQRTQALDDFSGPEIF